MYSFLYCSNVEFHLAATRLLYPLIVRGAFVRFVKAVVLRELDGFFSSFAVDGFYRCVRHAFFPVYISTNIPHALPVSAKQEPHPAIP